MVVIDLIKFQINPTKKALAYVEVTACLFSETKVVHKPKEEKKNETKIKNAKRIQKDIFRENDLDSEINWNL